jgi:hypothetical protein
MDPMQALNELNAAAASLNVNRQVHEHLVKCAQIIAEALQPKDSGSGEVA